ncbi:hypothetical protein E3J84_04580 [Candidatus Aerophobetes bacterium]|uniref:Uncharacterized protein n=1 Tax=Aerophobetes bacterium TaxID=2030807 RepID=A0A523RVX0_UNCAE|nr:MAG: hypothetical protein E3J84_04580 [Candidatus Aerophobetes bacterium]
MMQIAINKEEFKKIIKEAVKEAVEEEKVENFLKSIPPVSKQEIEKINELYGKPAKKKEPAYSEEMEV